MWGHFKPLVYFLGTLKTLGNMCIHLKTLVCLWGHLKHLVDFWGVLKP